MDLSYAVVLLTQALSLHQDDGWEHGPQWDTWAAETRGWLQELERS